jgi:hypothetical protein
MIIMMMNYILFALEALWGLLKYNERKNDTLSE